MGCGASKTKSAEGVGFTSVTAGDATNNTAPKSALSGNSKTGRRGKQVRVGGQDSEQDNHDMVAEKEKEKGKGKEKPKKKGKEKKKGKTAAKGKKGKQKAAAPAVLFLLENVAVHDQSDHLLSFFYDKASLSVALRNTQGTVYAVTFDDASLESFKRVNAVKLPPALFAKSLFSSMTSPSIYIQNNNACMSVSVQAKDAPATSLTFTLAAEKGNAVFKYFLLPFSKYNAEEGAKLPGKDLAKFVQMDASLKEGQESVRHIKASISLTTARVEREKQLLAEVKASEGGEPLSHLDYLYSIGGARMFAGHISYTKPYEPEEIEHNEGVLEFLSVFYNPKLEVPKTLLAENQELAKILGKIDCWDFNVFDLEKLTGGGSLFHTAYALMYKYGLVAELGIQLDVLTNFLKAVQAGYRPNSYHNSMHAADVLHVTHFMLTPGGLKDLVGLSPLDIFSSLLAAVIHDYDHPGFNNNFHTRTSAYLATLYNDRSVLENHHCACVFEMMLDARYDILATFSEEQRKEVRETVVELVLSTDMGNHARLISTFKRRLNETEDWVSKREDAKLGMVMAIKTADISNCARPGELYLRWADNITEEFYRQGDKEQLASLTVSPFMDRSKKDTDFSKGQFSFINFIVLPLFQTMSELLPHLKFSITHCEENRERWSESKK